MRKRNCITPELKYVVTTLKNAGMRPRSIHELLGRAGENISIRYVYILCGER